jgi:RNA polymerase sigma-70 factor, ECF subfamily
MTGSGDAGSTWTAFEADALPHAPGLFRLAMWLERDRQEAEDLVQETLTRALESFHRFERGTNCRAWLVSILQHVRSNRRRSRGRSPVVADVDELAAAGIAIMPEVPDYLTDVDVLRALEQLQPNHQEVIILCDVEELTYKEIARALGMPIGTVMSRLHRARAFLRAELAAYANSHGIGRVSPRSGSKQQ